MRSGVIGQVEVHHLLDDQISLPSILVEWNGTALVPKNFKTPIKEMKSKSHPARIHFFGQQASKQACHIPSFDG
jgi:hypothetical protein